MSKYAALSAISLLAVLTCAPALHAQRVDGPPSDQAPGIAEQLKQRKWNNSPPVTADYARKKKAGPAPRRDLSGLWDATASGGIEFLGAYEHPSALPGKDQGGQSGGPPAPDERKIINPIPYTAAGEAALKANKPSTGIRSIPAILTNDPVNICDPQGFPRMELYEFRVIELAQMKNHVIFTTQFYDNWRVIWTDGRALPNVAEVEPRWNGYAVGKWEDDYTFVVQTVGVDERTWLDNAGRPHTIDMRVEERYHRVDADTMELTVTINDPKYYSQPWQALNKFVLHRLPANFDMEEMFCSPSETADYNKLIGNPDAELTPTK